jgi:hypothetical protein
VKLTPSNVMRAAVSGSEELFRIRYNKGFCELLTSSNSTRHLHGSQSNTCHRTREKLHCLRESQRREDEAHISREKRPATHPRSPYSDETADKTRIQSKDYERFCELWFAAPVPPVQSMEEYEQFLRAFFQEKIQNHSPAWAVPVLASSSQDYRVISKAANETVEIWYAPAE